MGIKPAAYFSLLVIDLEEVFVYCRDEYLSDSCIAMSFSHPVVYIFTSLLVSCDEQNFLIIFI